MADEWSAISKVYDPLKAGSIDGTDTIPHDRGIERAMLAKYKPRKDQMEGDSDCTLFVSRLNPDTDEKSLLKAFQKYGDIVNVTVVRDIVTGFSKCYGFVEFKKGKYAMRARQDAHETVVDERVVFVDWEFSRSMPGWVPRRLGGGFGGKKESGQLRFGGRDRPFKKPINLHHRGSSYESRDVRGYADDVDRHRDRDRRGDKDKYRDRDRDKDRDSYRNRDRDKYRDRDSYRDRDKEDRDRYRDRDRRPRIKDEEEEDRERDERRRDREGRV